MINFIFPWIKDRFYKSFTINFFEEYLDWFMGWPAGFKFNANLTKFFGKFFLSLLAIWKGNRNLLKRSFINLISSCIFFF